MNHFPFRPCILVVIGISAGAGAWTFVGGGGRRSDFATPDKSPRLVVPQEPVHLGSGYRDEIVDGAVVLSNEGAAPLSIDVSASCGCTDVSPRVATIAPSELLTLRFGVRLEEPGRDRTVQITVASNDPTGPVRTFPVMATCLAPIATEPARIDFGSSDHGTFPPVRLRAWLRSGDRLDAMTGVVVEADDPRIVTDVGTEEDGSLGVVVQLVEPIVAPVRGTIHIRTASRGFEAEIPVEADYVPKVVVAPAWIKVRSGEPFHEQVILSSTSDEPLGPLERSESPAGIVVTELTPKPGRRRQFLLSGDGPNSENLPAEVRLHLRGSHEPSVVRLDITRVEGSDTTFGGHPR